MEDNKKNKNRILGIILARGGSKGVPKKNIRLINGIPLIAYTIKEGLKSKYISRLVVSTEDKEIAAIAKDFGAEVPFMRPEELAGDNVSSKVCLQHATKFMEGLEGEQYGYVIELMVTNPLKTVEDIDSAIKKLIDTRADSVIGVVKTEEYHPARLKKIVNDRIVNFCVPEPNGVRRQDLKPHAYIRNGSIYAIKRDVLMVQGYRYGTRNSRPYIFLQERSVNIDSLEDFYVAEYRLKNSRYNKE
jgi:CMP-N-acetylneuraminic acid synthetase